MNMIFAIFIGGGFGAVARHYAILQASKLFGDAFPYGTMIVNIAGSFLIGAIIEAFALKYNASPEVRALLTTGFLGGFTTFSAFSLDVFKLAGTGQYAYAAGYAAASVFFSLLAVFAGAFLIRGVIGA